MKPAVIHCAAVGLALVLVACGGSGQGAKGGGGADELANQDGTEPAEGGTPAQATPEQKLRTQQESTCAPMCERLADCAVEDLRANKTPEEIAAMDLDTLMPRYMDECNGECNRSALSPRQIEVVRGCLAQPLDCAAYLDCLDDARRK